ncbi:hypothetical protein BH10BAC3_BH10BAC3_34740 [soil metagenome]
MAAFEVLYKKYAPILLQRCSRICNDHHLIYNCLHDLFVDLWSNKMNLSTPDSVKAYLGVSLQRKIIKYLKDNRYSPTFLYETSDRGIVHSIEEEIVSVQNKQELNAEIFRVLNSLSRRQKQALSLKFYGNLSYAEIADEMGIGTASVYNLISIGIYNMQYKMRV